MGGRKHLRLLVSVEVSGLSLFFSMSLWSFNLSAGMYLFFSFVIHLYGADVMARKCHKPVWDDVQQQRGEAFSVKITA